MENLEFWRIVFLSFIPVGFVFGLVGVIAMKSAFNPAMPFPSPPIYQVEKKND